MQIRPFVLSLLLTCAGVAPTAGLPTDTPMAAPTLRLPGDVRPVEQSVELRIDPDREPYAGSVEIELDVLRQTPVVWLNAVGLDITTASVARQGTRQPVQVVPGGDDFVGFAPDRPLAAGRATLRVEFAGRVSRTEKEGLFAMKEAGQWYVFTQFEATAARRAFPCFDEPSFKIPWRVALHVPAASAAFGNSRAVATTSESGGSLVRFAPTRPLPSYLVALAVGPFDTVDLGTIGRARVPSRLIVPRGRAADTRWAGETTPRLLALLEDWFDRPYPYDKLDQVAVPGFGMAMEHPGLVTYGMGMMVRRPQEESVPWRRSWVSVAAHEFAHQWFGNLVTMAWWDDAWLNESFASWLGDKIVDRFAPDWRMALERLAIRSGGLDADSLATARRVRQPIVSKHDIANVFDGITYAKGQAVLEMVEGWVGEEAFRRGVRSYVDRHAWGNATAHDFIGALSEAAGRDVSGVLSAFLDQTGAPVISSEIRCDGTPRLILKQRPYVALGSAGEAKSWRVPVCARLPGNTQPVCTELASAERAVPLQSGSTCPEWAYANADGAGYFRTAFSAEWARRSLAAGILPAKDRLAVAGDLAALVASGDVAAADALSLAVPLAADPEWLVVDAAARLAIALESTVDDGRLTRYREFVRSAFAGPARELGLASREGESEDTAMRRRSVLLAAGIVGRDPELERRAAEIVRRWIDEPTVADQAVLPLVLVMGGGAADRALFDRLRTAAIGATDRLRRTRLLAALGSVTDPDLAREALSLTLDDRIDPRESVSIVFRVSSRRETARLALDFTTQHYDRLLARLPGGSMSPVAYLPAVGTTLCAPETRAEVQRFFGPRTTGVEGGPRILAQELETLDQCVARRRSQGASVAAFLDAWAANETQSR